MAKTQPPKGTRDFYPEAMRRRRTLEDVWRRVSLRAGFEEVDGPILESLDLYRQKSGDEIVDQLYSFEDKGGRPVAIRPEFTPTLARMVVARQAALPKPVKWFNISRVCRYERSQKGRLREFFQWNCDILGEASICADLECIMVAIDSLKALGLTAKDVEVRLSSRKLLAALLQRLGLPAEVIPRVYLCLDKRGKVPDEVVGKMLGDLKITDAQRQGIDGIFSTTRLDAIGVSGDSDAVAGPLAELAELFRLVTAAGGGEFVRFDIGIVRGLAYYTGPVWEVFDKRGKLRSLFGGGRYDNLIETCGGQAMPACGFGAGDVTMSLLLDSLDLWGERGGPELYVVVWASEAAVTEAVAVTQRLRDSDRYARYGLGPSSFRRQMKAAADAGAAYVVIVGLEDCPAGTVRLRDMATGQERDLTVDELLAR